MKVHKNAAGKNPRKPRRKAEPVEVKQVPDVVMKAARKLAKERGTEVIVKSDGTVIVP